MRQLIKRTPGWDVIEWNDGPAGVLQRISTFTLTLKLGRTRLAAAIDVIHRLLLESPNHGLPEY